MFLFIRLAIIFGAFFLLRPRHTFRDIGEW